jgi:D-glucuronyl C5-epimerase-like protein
MPCNESSRTGAGRRYPRQVRRRPIAALAAALTVLALPGVAGARGTVLVLDGHGRAHARQERFLPPPDPAPARVRATVSLPARAAKAKRTVKSELDRLLLSAAIDQARHDLWLADYNQSAKTFKKLRGRRRIELGAVLANARALAARRQLTPTRAPAAFLTLERNRAWWSTGPLLGANQRVAFPGSQLVWQYYPGQGLQIQWLGTFGKANGLYSSRKNTALAELLDEALALATARAGGIAFESFFRFDGGRPPWVSGLSQGTAVQAFARGSVRLKDPRYLAAARSLLGIFQVAPPQGVRVATATGAFYLQYSFAPTLHIFNGFIQALNGLHDLATLADDVTARALFAAGEADARVEAPTFDTGAWSLYSRPGSESPLTYHLLVRDFLRGLCERMEADLAAAQTGPPSGGAVPAPPLPDPTLYCTEAEKFTAYLSRPPVMALVPTVPRAHKRSKIVFTIDKRSSVTLVLRRAGRAVLTRSFPAGRGRHFVPFVPIKAGPLAIELRAVDLAGNAASISGAVVTRRGPRHGK